MIHDIRLVHLEIAEKCQFWKLESREIAVKRGESYAEADNRDLVARDELVSRLKGKLGHIGSN